MAALLLVVVLGSVGGVYAWRMVDAIVHAERSAVVPLPPSENDFAWDDPTAVSGADDPTALPGDIGGPVGTETPIDVRAEDPNALPTATAQPGQHRGAIADQGRSLPEQRFPGPDWRVSRHR